MGRDTLADKIIEVSVTIQKKTYSYHFARIDEKCLPDSIRVEARCKTSAFDIAIIIIDC